MALVETEDDLEYNFFTHTKQALKFKVKAKNDAHVAISTTDHVSDPMYEVFFGGWNNSKIAIRKNRQQPDVAVLDFPNTLSSETYKEFWITWYDKMIAVGICDNTVPVLFWSDPEMFESTYYGVRTGWGSTGSWVINDVWYGWKLPSPDHLPPLVQPGWNLPTIRGCSPPVWTSASQGVIPPGAVAGGFDKEQLFIGRASFGGALIPGKVHPSHGCCYVAWGGREHAINSYEVLCSCAPSWFPATGGIFPPAAVKAGRTEDGEDLLIGRAHYNNAMVIGKVQPSHKRCYIPYAGQEVAVEEFDVLVL